MNVAARPERVVLPDVQPWVWPWLRDWQRDGIPRAIAARDFHLHWACGSGKTVAAILWAFVSLFFLVFRFACPLPLALCHLRLWFVCLMGSRHGFLSVFSVSFLGWPPFSGFAAALSRVSASL